jgi:hypothetical protein
VLFLGHLLVRAGSSVLDPTTYGLGLLVLQLRDPGPFLLVYLL